MWAIISQIFPYAMAFTAPLLITSLGGLFSEKSGVVNIGLEGLMVIGSFSSALVISSLQHIYPEGAIWLGILAAMIAGILFSLLHAFASINLNANQVISGTAINMIAGALTVFIARNLTGSGNIHIMSGLTRFKRACPEQHSCNRKTVFQPDIHVDMADTSHTFCFPLCHLQDSIRPETQGMRRPSPCC